MKKRSQKFNIKLLNRSTGKGIGKKNFSTIPGINLVRVNLSERIFGKFHSFFVLLIFKTSKDQWGYPLLDFEFALPFLFRIQDSNSVPVKSINYTSLLYSKQFKFFNTFVKNQFYKNPIFDIYSNTIREIADFELKILAACKISQLTKLQSVKPGVLNILSTIKESGKIQYLRYNALNFLHTKEIDERRLTKGQNLVNSIFWKFNNSTKTIDNNYKWKYLPVNFSYLPQNFFPLYETNLKSPLQYSNRPDNKTKNNETASGHQITEKGLLVSNFQFYNRKNLRKSIKENVISSFNKNLFNTFLKQVIQLSNNSFSTLKRNYIENKLVQDSIEGGDAPFLMRSLIIPSQTNLSRYFNFRTETSGETNKTYKNFEIIKRLQNVSLLKENVRYISSFLNKDINTNKIVKLAQIFNEKKRNQHSISEPALVHPKQTATKNLPQADSLPIRSYQQQMPSQFAKPVGISELPGVDKTPVPDVNQVAEKVYTIIENRLRVERERRGIF